MRYLSICSGIEAASVAWHPLDWQCAGVSEIEAFPRAVLQHRLGARPVDWDHRYTPQSNMLPLFGDFTKIEAHHVGPIDLLVGGTPCQSFSVAGKRLGLDDPRGHLTLEYLALAQRLRPRWLVWENVPGVLSDDGGRTLGTFLRILGGLGYRWAYRVLDAQYVRVGGFGRAVPQRRRRVFVVGHLGDDARAAAVLFDRESLCGNPAPRRETGQSPSPTLAARTRGGGGLGTDFDCDGGLVCREVSPALKARDYKGVSSDGDGDGAPLVAHALRGEGFDASEDRTGRGTPLVPVAIQAGAMRENPNSGPGGIGVQQGIAYTLDARAEVQAVAFAENSRAEIRLCGGDGAVSSQLTTGGGKPGQGQPCIAFPAEMSATQHASTEGLSPTLSVKHTTAIAFSAKDYGNDAAEGVAPTLRAGGFTGSHQNGGVMPAVAFDMRGREGGAMPEGPHETANIRAADGGSSRSYVAEQWAVRRLTPAECARLQGFPDDWARIPWRGKPADQCPDGPQYKAYGNSMAVNCMRWIGERIATVDTLNAQEAQAA